MKSLLSSTLALVRRDRRTLEQLSCDSGLNRHWLMKFKQGKIEDPGVKKIESLYNFFASEKTRKKNS